MSTSSCLILLCFHDFKMFYSLWDIKPMIIDFSICRGIFNDNVYVLCLCPQDFFTSSRTYVQYFSAYVGYLSHTFVMELDLFIYFPPERISQLLQPKLLFTLFCVSLVLYRLASSLSCARLRLNCELLVFWTSKIWIFLLRAG